jgi:ligand-binding SRPBCC domain-containing protein
LAKLRAKLPKPFMRIIITTPVAKNYLQVAHMFDEKLLSSLNPPFPPVKIVRYDGSTTGDEVHLQLNFILFKQIWKSLITAHHADEKEIYFIDEGIQLPFFLKYWRHKHIVAKDKQGACIIDDVTFKTPFFLFDYVLYPVLYLQFLYRKPIYKKYFS